MFKNKETTLFHGNPMLLEASESQRKFINDSTYCIRTPGGKSYLRTFELLAYSAHSGNALIKEKVSFSGDNYEKVYVLSPEGKSEKYREECF